MSRRFCSFLLFRLMGWKVDVTVPMADKYIIALAPHTALKAGLPILLYGIDYPTKTIRCTQVVVPNGNIDKQMNDIKAYFKDFTGRHPEKFATGLK